MWKPLNKIGKNPGSYSPKKKPEIIKMAEALQEEPIKGMEFGTVELVSLPVMRVASYEVTSREPEQTAIQFVENWLKNKGLTVGENGVRGFGFDCHKGREIPRKCRIYHVYYSVPESVKGDSEGDTQNF